MTNEKLGEWRERPVFWMFAFVVAVALVMSVADYVLGLN